MLHGILEVIFFIRFLPMIILLLSERNMAVVLEMFNTVIMTMIFWRNFQRFILNCFQVIFICLQLFYWASGVIFRLRLIWNKFIRQSLSVQLSKVFILFIRLISIDWMHMIILFQYSLDAFKSENVLII
jgi:hypothetical protein